MPIEILGEPEQARMRRAGAAARAVLRRVLEGVEPGVTTAELDAEARRVIASAGLRSSQLGFHGFPAAICTSVNEVVCHGMPSTQRRLELGDIVNVDVTTELDGWHGDTSITVGLGPLSPDRRKVLDVARRCLEIGIARTRAGVRLGDIGAAIEAEAHRHGCGSVSDFGGHGIGRAMHQPPMVLHVGPAGRGLRLRAGMCITLEPMITLGRPRLRTLADGWTVVTEDGSPSAQFEHTLLVTPSGCELLTADP